MAIISHQLSRARRAAAAAAAAALLAAGCGGEAADPAETPGLPAASGDTAEPAAPADSAEPVVSAEPAEAAAGAETVLQHVLEQLTAAERDCVLAAASGTLIEQLTDPSAVAEQALVGCVGAGRARMLLSGTAAEPADPVTGDPVESDGSGAAPLVRLDEDAFNECVSEVASVEDLLDWSSNRTQDWASAVEALEVMIECDPYVFVDLIVEESAIDPATVTDETYGCMAVGLGGVDLRDEDAAALGMFALMQRCGLPIDAPAGLAAGREPLTAAERGAALPFEVAEPAVGELAAGEAQVVYSVALRDGRFYRIRVEPGTLTDPAVTLYDSDGQEVAHNDDADASTLAALIEVTAGPQIIHYVAVSGWGDAVGSYTLTVDEAAG